MPLTPLHSAEWLNYIATPQIKQEPRKWNSRLQITSASLVLAAAGQGTAKMLRLPPGKIRVWSAFSRLVCPQGAASSTLSIGNAAYVKEDGSVGAANANLLGNAIATSSAALAQALPLPASGYIDLDSQDGIDIEAAFAGGNTAASGEVLLAIAFTRAG